MFGIGNYSASEIHALCADLYTLGEKGKEHLQIVEDPMHSSRTKKRVFGIVCAKKFSWTFFGLFKSKSRRLNDVVQHTIQILAANEGAILDEKFIAKNAIALKHFLKYFEKKPLKSHVEIWRIHLILKKIDEIQKKYLKQAEEITREDQRASLELKEKCEKEEFLENKNLLEARVFAASNNPAARVAAIANSTHEGRRRHKKKVIALL